MCSVNMLCVGIPASEGLGSCGLPDVIRRSGSRKVARLITSRRECGLRFSVSAKNIIPRKCLKRKQFYMFRFVSRAPDSVFNRTRAACGLPSRPRQRTNETRAFRGSGRPPSHWLRWTKTSGAAGFPISGRSQPYPRAVIQECTSPSMATESPLPRRCARAVVPRQASSPSHPIAPVAPADTPSSRRGMRPPAPPRFHRASCLCRML